MTAADRRRRCRRRRAQHLLHPRERRQQALRHARAPQVAKDRRPGLRDRGRRLPGPEGPGRHPRAGALRRRRVRHPQRPPGRRAAPPRPRTRARSPRSSTRPCSRITSCSRRPCPPAASTATPPGSPSRSAATTRCAFCIVPGGARPGDQPPVRATRRRGRGSWPPTGVTEVTLLGQNVNSYGRDLTWPLARPATTCRVRPLFADLLPGRRRGRGHPPGPLHQPAPQGPAARDHRRHGRDAGGVRAPPPARCSPGSDRVLAAMHRGYTAERYLEKLAAARAAIADLAVTTDIIVGFPGETDDDFERTLERGRRGRVRLRLHLHLLAPSGHRGRRAGRQFVAPDVVAERFERLEVVVERWRWPSTEPASAGSRRSWSRARREGPDAPVGPHPAEQARALRQRRPAAGRHLRRGRGHRRRAALPARSAGRGHRRRPPPHRIPVAAGLIGGGGGPTTSRSADTGPVIAHQVRSICVETGYMGGPITWQWRAMPRASPTSSAATTPTASPSPAWWASGRAGGRVPARVP